MSAGSRRAPLSAHIMLKPTGAACNLACAYCFYRAKEALYPGGSLRMTEDVLEIYLRQRLEGERAPHVTIAWQGGEPTLLDLDFFERAVALAEKYKPAHTQVEHTIQTNGVRLNDEWCAFFRRHGFLVGLSIDGPRALHDTYRVDAAGHGTFDKVVHAAKLLRDHGAAFNILCAVHAANAEQPLATYRFFRDELGAEFIQLIPIVERTGGAILDRGHDAQAQRPVTDRSVVAEKWGELLITLFDEWVRHDVGRVFLPIFEAALASWMRLPQSMCAFAETCGQALALEHNGDLYSCDHFVTPEHLLGNIRDTPIANLVGSDKQRTFARAKRDSLPGRCRQCVVRFACHGECPRNRFLVTPEGEPGLNYLCAGYEAFFRHIDKPMQILAGLLRRGRNPAEVMTILKRNATPSRESDNG